MRLFAPALLKVLVERGSSPDFVMVEMEGPGLLSQVHSVASVTLLRPASLVEFEEVRLPGLLKSR